MNLFLIALVTFGALALIGISLIGLKRLGDPPKSFDKLTESELQTRYPKLRRTHPRKDRKGPRNKRTMKRIKGNYNRRSI